MNDISNKLFKIIRLGKKTMKELSESLEKVSTRTPSGLTHDVLKELCQIGAQTKAGRQKVIDNLVNQNE